MTVTIEVDQKWVRAIRSPLFTIASALTGVSVTFAPLFLFWTGKGKFFPGYEWFVVPVCFAIIYLVPFFYFILGNMVAKEVRGSSK
jgi:hypothetical protein